MGGLMRVVSIIGKSGKVPKEQMEEVYRGMGK